MNLTQLSSIVVPFDFSELAYDALRAALSIAPPDRVHVAHVLPVAGGLSWAVGGASGDTARVEGTRQRIERELLKHDLGGTSCPIHIRVGAPGPEICELADSLKADLIIIGSHGRGGIGKLILGSVAYDVVRNATATVMLMRPKVAVA